MSKQLSVREIELTLTSGQQRMLNLQGNFVKVFSATTEFKINLGGGFQRAKAGSKFSNVDFIQIEVLESQGATNTIVLKYGDGVYDDGQGEVTVSGSVSSKPSSDGLVSTPDVTLATGATSLILAANSLRDRVLIQRVDANSGDARIGDANAGAARGVKMVQDSSLEITSTGAIYGYQNSGANMTFAILEETSS